MVSLEPLRLTLKEKGISATELVRRLRLHPRTVSSITQDGPISLQTVERICKDLEVPIEKVVKVI